MLRRSHTAVTARNERWEGRFETEPYEAGWSGEAIAFIRVLDARGGTDRVPLVTARVQISPDGMNWCDEGTAFEVARDQTLSFAKVNHFGSWLRIVGSVAPGAHATVIAYWSLKE